MTIKGVYIDISWLQDEKEITEVRFVQHLNYL